MGVGGAQCQYGYSAFPGETFVKDWSEYQGLSLALEQAGIAAVKAPVTVGPLGSTAYRMQLTDIGDALKPDYVVIERQYSETLAIEYPDKPTADQTLRHSLFIARLGEEDCLDAYVTTVLPAGAHIVISPEEDIAGADIPRRLGLGPNSVLSV